MPYWRLFYHIVWATKDRQPLIKNSLAAKLHEHISGNATQLGAVVHAVGGMEDHVHMAVSVPPSMALSEFIRKLKGSSSHFVNHELPAASAFAWQGDYGIISLDSKQLDRVVLYIKEQMKYHTEKTTIPALERLIEE
ncbi:MAG: IS200/IS605 family transposase, partial [Dehalococcoidia bacterium]|nr:IS200/IS605 family transposase [Dehalococcoidia bacterium]